MPAAGDYVRASDVTHPYVRKTATESVTTSSVLQDDDELFVSVEANSFYIIAAVLFYDGATTGDFKFKFIGPTSATFGFSAMIPSLAITTVAGNTTNFDAFDETDTLSVGAVGAGTVLSIAINGILVVSSTAGTFKLQWAQGTSDATASRVFANSFIKLTKVT